MVRLRRILRRRSRRLSNRPVCPIRVGRRWVNFCVSRVQIARQAVIGEGWWVLRLNSLRRLDVARQLCSRRTNCKKLLTVRLERLLLAFLTLF